MPTITSDGLPQHRGKFLLTMASRLLAFGEPGVKYCLTICSLSKLCHGHPHVSLGPIHKVRFSVRLSCLSYNHAARAHHNRLSAHEADKCEWAQKDSKCRILCPQLIRPALQAIHGLGPDIKLIYVDEGKLWAQRFRPFHNVGNNLQPAQRAATNIHQKRNRLFQIIFRYVINAIL